MTPTQFRTLLIAAVALGLLGAFVDVLFPTLVEEAFQQAQQTVDEKTSRTRLLVTVAVAIPVLVVYLVSLFGLFKFRSWAPRVSIAGTLLTVLVWPLFGTMAMSGLSLAISYFASYLWGAVLLAAYTPTIRQHFLPAASGAGTANDA